MSVRSAQSKAISRCLDFNETKAPQSESPWKVLVYDRHASEIIAPLLRVGKLREHGITLHLRLDSPRDAIPETHAIYIVRPTDEAVQRIGEDVAARLYAKIHVNFLSPVPRPLLEKMAGAVLSSGGKDRIGQVFDQFIDFVALEHSLFTLNMSNTFKRLNSPRTTDESMRGLITSIVDGLFGFLITTNTVPVIRCPRGGPAQMVATELDAKLREQLVARGNLFARQRLAATTTQRPVLVLLDRSVDLPVLLHHTWTYQALVHDVLGLSLNRVSFEAPPTESSPLPERKSYDLDPDDPFWSENADLPFPRVAEAVDAKVAEYKKKKDDISKLSSGLRGAAGVAAATGDAEALAEIAQSDPSSAAALAGVVDQLPQLAETKRIIDKHTNIATALLEHIKTRELDQYFSQEEAMMLRQGPPDKFQLLAQMAGGGGTAEDKLRLFVIYYLTCVESTDEETYGQFRAALESNHVDTRALAYLRRMRSMERSSGAKLARPTRAGPSSDMSRMMGATVLQGLAGLAGKVKNLLPAQKDLPATRLVSSAMEGAEGFVEFDPKMMGGGAGRPRAPFKEGIVFMVGGGNYTEYVNMKQRLGEAGKHVVYGTSDIVSAPSFLDQLGELGQDLS